MLSIEYCGNLLAATTTTTKIRLQTIWQSSIGWDEISSDEILVSPKRYRNTLHGGTFAVLHYLGVQYWILNEQNIIRI